MIPAAPNRRLYIGPVAEAEWAELNVLPVLRRQPAADLLDGLEMELAERRLASLSRRYRCILANEPAIVQNDALIRSLRQFEELKIAVLAARLENEKARLAKENRTGLRKIDGEWQPVRELEQ